MTAQDLPESKCDVSVEPVRTVIYLLTDLQADRGRRPSWVSIQCG